VPVLLLMVVSGCSPTSDLAGVPSPSPDPVPSYAPSLQPWAQAAADALPPLPTYQLSVDIAADGSSLAGRAVVTVPNAGGQPLSELFFRLYPNTPHYQGAMRVSSVLVDGVTAVTEPTAEGAALRVVLPNALLSGEQVVVEMDYAVDLPQGASDYTLFGWANGVLSLPGFYPALAEYAVGADGVDWLVTVPPLFADVHFAALALYELDLTAPASLMVVASGVVIGQQRMDDGGSSGASSVARCEI
jgi:hypothetical protein